MKKNKILKISILILSIVAIFLVIGITYAYFGVNRKGNEDNILASSCFNLELTANNILSEGNVPMTDEEAKTLRPYVFVIKNTCATSAEVGINLDILKTTNATLSNYKVSMSNGVILAPTLIDNLEADDISNNDTLLTKKLASVYVAGNSEKTLELRLWMKESVGVGEGENEIIESKISLTATAIPIELTAVQEKIIADNGGILKIRGKSNVNFNEVFPEIIYKESSVESKTKITLKAGSSIKISSSYSFEPIGGIYTLNDPISEPLNENHIGMYTCANETNSCTEMYKIKEVNINSIKENYTIQDPVEKTMDVTSTLTGNKTFGKSFHLNQSTGRFVLDETVTDGAYTDEYIGYYVCSQSATKVGGKLCNYIHQIKEVKTDPGEGAYYSEESLDLDNYYAAEENTMISSSYEFNSETGIYTLINPITTSTYTNDHIGYYTCATTEASCDYLIKFKAIEDGAATIVDEYIATPRYHHLTKTLSYSKTLNNSYINLSDKYIRVHSDYVRESSGLFLEEDDFGDTYYFRGGNDWNNLYFAGYYWNIVRINGDGSLRLIYRGTTPTATGTQAVTEINIFNTASENLPDAAYMGYMYGSFNGSNESKLSNIRNSAIKDTLESWYETQLMSFDNYIADTIFCNDRSQKGELDINNGYNTYERLGKTEFAPTFKCIQKNDRFTVSNSFGNRSNKYPIGLLTTDEAVFAGMNRLADSPYNYLNIQSNFWTMTPGWYSGKLPYFFYINYSKVDTIGANSTTKRGIRPVINLKGNVILSGAGTLEDPYRVEGLQTE